MHPPTDKQCLHSLRDLYRQAFKLSSDTVIDSSIVLIWAASPGLWATHQIRHHGWSFEATEAVVRQCRRLGLRAARAAGIPWRAAEPAPLRPFQAPPAGLDPFDPLMPSEPTQQQKPEA